MRLDLASVGGVSDFWTQFMRLDADARRCVVFLGHCADPDKDETFKALGTGFFLTHDGMRFLVTAQHVAHALGDDPYALRLNLTDGSGSHTIIVDPGMEDEFRWISHSDSSVDLAVALFQLDLASAGLDDLSMSADLILTDAHVAQLGINVGDLCYGVGLFHLLQGSKRNVPVVHTGHIALMPSDEEITVEDWTAPKGSGRHKAVRGYLVELQNLKGLSGSPVLVRPTKQAYGATYERDGQVPRLGPAQFMGAYDADPYLLGVWSASWDGLAAGAAFAEYGSSTRVPVGLGTVVPSSRLLELLQSEVVRGRKVAWNELAQLRRDTR